MNSIPIQCGALEEALEASGYGNEIARSGEDFNEEAHGSCEVYEKCCKQGPCNPTDLGKEEC